MGESQRYNIMKKKSSIKDYVVQRQAKLILGVISQNNSYLWKVLPGKGHIEAFCVLLILSTRSE